MYLSELLGEEPVLVSIVVSIPACQNYYEKSTYVNLERRKPLNNWKILKNII